MRIKSVVHTGANIHDGGFNGALFKVEYQEPMAGIVNIEPIQPARSGMASETTSFIQFDFFIEKV